MTDATATMGIGELARRTGLPVRTIRFYSDSGVLPPSGRTESGYRRYGSDALARLELVRTLRDLGIDLATIRRLLEREVTVPDVAAAHAAALDAQIRVLKAQRAVLRAVARRGSDPQEMRRMHELARLSADERRRIVADFIDEAFAGLDIEPGFAERMRSATPELPDDPGPEQVGAWIELAELVRDPGFRETIRRMSEGHAAPVRAASRPAAPRRKRCSRRSCPRSARTPPTPPRGPRSPTASRREPTPAPSATGSCSRSSTAGRRSRPPCRPGSG